MESGNRLRVLLILVCLLGCSVPAAAAPLARLTMLFDSPLGASQAPYYLALERGWYAAAGLEVVLSPGDGGEEAAKAVGSGAADVAAADVAAVLAARARGAPIKIIASVGDKSPICTFFISGGAAEKPLGLEGKRIAVDPFDSQLPFFPLLAGANGVHTGDIVLQPMELSRRIVSIAAGSADATFGTLDQAPELGAAIGRDRLGRFLWADFGFDLYGGCLLTSENILRKSPSALRAFLSVSFKAWEYALRHPDQAVSAMAKHRIVDPSLVKAFEEGLADANALFDTAAYRSKGIGFLETGRMESTMRALTERLGLPMGFTASEAMTSSLLPVPPVKMPAQKPGEAPQKPAAPDKAPPESATL